ncbi:hypothetical protein [Paracoccus homiensis]|uniref:hypothetical protein n=1 Tax=Paracoccus homiensis TaxID=364199 RepID=UPI003CCBE2B1
MSGFMGVYGEADGALTCAAAPVSDLVAVVCAEPGILALVIGATRPSWARRSRSQGGPRMTRF